MFTLAGLWGHQLRATSVQLVALLLAMLAAVSRVIVGVHWPIDVLTGTAGGCLSAALGWRLSLRWHWGLSVSGHLILVWLLAIGALALFGYDGGYSEARWLAEATAILALGMVLRDYIVLPSRLWRSASAGMERSSCAAGGEGT